MESIKINRFCLNDDNIFQLYYSICPNDDSGPVGLITLVYSVNMWDKYHSNWPLGTDSLVSLKYGSLYLKAPVSSWWKQMGGFEHF